MSYQNNIDVYLRQIRNYSNYSQEVIKAHVRSLQGDFALMAGIGSYSGNGGFPLQMCSLSGTIPIVYHQNTYHIPIKVWFPYEYPARPPICLVDPTPDMAISPRHKHVSEQGLVYMPYLNHWNNQSTLLEALVTMASLFSEVPPVFKKPANYQPGNQGFNPNPNHMANANRAPMGMGGGAAFKQSSSNGSLAADRKEKLVKEVTAKLKVELEKFNKSKVTDIDSLFLKQSQLESGHEQVKRTLKNMELEKNLLATAIADLTSQIEASEAWLKEKEEAKEEKIDDIVVANDIWTEQLFEEVASDRAIDETMYQLQRALINDDVDCDLKDFLKLIRRLSRSQFKHRALALKIAEAQRQEHAQAKPQYI